MPDPINPEGSSQSLNVTRRGAAAVVTLDRPAARNALSRDMQAKLAQAVQGFSRDPLLYAVILKSAVPGVFSVGGDVREIMALAGRDIATARQALASELRLCWYLECLWKPAVSFIDGHVMGTGVGISLYNTHRVAGERYSFAMPETQIGYFPDCGVAHAFARMPHGIGRYLALTGRALDWADAYALGLVTHCIPSAKFAGIEAQLADAEPIDPLLDDAHVDPGPSPMLAEAVAIERVFSAPTLAELIQRLETSGAPDAEFRSATLALLRARSPLALTVTDQLVRNAGKLDIRECLIQDFRVAHRFAALADFHEGVRAFLVDKDRRPKWHPVKILDVRQEDVQAFFAASVTTSWHYRRARRCKLSVREVFIDKAMAGADFCVKHHIVEVRFKCFILGN